MDSLHMRTSSQARTGTASDRVEDGANELGRDMETDNGGAIQETSNMLISHVVTGNTCSCGFVSNAETTSRQEGMIYLHLASILLEWRIPNGLRVGDILTWTAIRPAIRQ